MDEMSIILTIFSYSLLLYQLYIKTGIISKWNISQGRIIIKQSPAYYNVLTPCEQKKNCEYVKDIYPFHDIHFKMSRY